MGAAPSLPEREDESATRQLPPTLLAARGGPGLKVPPGHFRCAKCGAAFLADAEFCASCGEARPPSYESICYCGSSFEREEIFCRKCGAPAGAMVLLVKLKRAAQERLRWSRDDDPASFEAWNVNAKLDSEFSYMHSLLRNRLFVEVVMQEYKDFDGNKDGTLDQQEVAQAVPKLSLKHGWKTEAEISVINHEVLTEDFFKQMDRDYDARVSLDEFLVYLAHFHYLCYQQRVACPEIFHYEGIARSKRRLITEAENAQTSRCCAFP